MGLNYVGLLGGTTMYLPMDDVRLAYEFSKSAKLYHLNFKEYAMLYRLYEGVAQSNLPESLYVSQPTLSRCKKRLIKKFKVHTFSQLLLKIGNLSLFDDVGLLKK